MENIKHIHFVGIGGAGMGGIAEVLLKQGYQISGSDTTNNQMTQRLSSLGVKISYGHEDSHIEGADLVVFSSAIAPDNPEVVAARHAQVPIIQRAQMLAELMRLKQGIAIAGTHGKTTTTAMLASILIEAGLDPTFVVGGLLKSAGTNARFGSGNYFVAEADESDASFLHLAPQIAVITNIDADHMPTYENDFARLTQAFLDFLQRLPEDGIAVLYKDDKVITGLLTKIPRPFLTYGLSEDVDYRATNIVQEGTKTNFTLINNKKNNKYHVTVNLPGQHNVLNALAAISVAAHLGVSNQVIFDALKTFSGVGRRFQICGELKLHNGQALLIDDYGHHPREIIATIEAIRNAWPNRRLVTVFQPHRYTRTKNLFADFVDVLIQTDKLFLLDIYAASEVPIATVSGKKLFQAILQKGHRDAIFVEQLQELPALLKQHLQDGDVVLLQGAGSIGKVAAELAEKGLP